MKSILCYGDSNTHGFDASDYGRFPYDVRWTGRLAKLLGEDFLVHEAGLNGRTTVYDDPDVPCRNGLAALDYFLVTHKPIDLFIVMLGTNDTKDFFNADENDTSRGVEEIVKRVLSFPYENCPAPTPLIISPAPMDERVDGVHCMSMLSVEKSRRLGAALNKLCSENGWHFLDAASWGLELDEDGCHLHSGDHAVFAKKLSEYILKEIF